MSSNRPIRRMAFMLALAAFLSLYGSTTSTSSATGSPQVSSTGLTNHGRTPKVKNPPIDLRFQCSMDNPGVRTVVTWKKKQKKHPKKALNPVFHVSGKETVGMQENDSTFFVHINHMQRWSPKCPATYAVTLSVGGSSVTRSFGIHDISVCGGMLCVNDTTILYKGLVENALPLSTAKTTEEWHTYFEGIKQQGFTVISLSRKYLSHEMMAAADRCGIVVHARVTPPEKVVAVKKKRKKKRGDISELSKRLEEEYREHPSLCLATFMEGADMEQSDKYLPASLFKPVKDMDGKFLPDYTMLLDTTKVCMADFSDITDEKELETCLEKTLCTPGVGVLLFSSMEQASAWKDFMILGKFDREEWDSSMSMSMDLYVANNSEEDIHSTKFVWDFMDENGFVFSDGFENNHRFLPHTANYVATAFTPMAFIFPNDDVTLTMRMDNSEYKRSWTHKIHYPFHIRGMNEKIHNRMREWCTRKSDETDEGYANRVNDVTKAKKKMLFATEVVTEEVGGLIKGKEIKLSRVNGSDGLLTIALGDAHPIKLKMPQKGFETLGRKQEDGTYALDVEDLEVKDSRFSLTNKDDYELVYADICNKRTGISYIYVNEESENTLARILIHDKFVPPELKELAEHEDKILKQIKQKIIQEAKEQNVISDHTKVDVNAAFETDFDEKGNTLNNYHIVFEYNVESQYSSEEDFAPGRYRIEDSHAAISMLHVITSAFAKEFGRYITPGKKLDISITGSADSSPIRGSIAYDGCYGEFNQETYFLGSEENKITVTSKEGIRQNEQLAFMRARGVSDFLQKNLTATRDMNVRYLHNIELPKGKGGEFRRIKVCFSFVNIF